MSQLVVVLVVTGKGDVIISLADDDLPKLMAGQLNPQQVGGLQESLLLCFDFLLQHCIAQGSFRSGKTGKCHGICVIRESQGNVREKYYFF